jgi:cytochrome b561
VKEERKPYTMTAVALHWLLAALIFCTFVFGLWMTGLETSPAKLRYYDWHKWAGITILTLSAARLLWRLSHPPPPELPMPPWQRSTARATHGLLYALFFAVPLVGWAYSSAAGFPVVLFGMLPLPDFVPVDKELAAAIRMLHRWLAYSLAALVLVHVAAALKHHFVDRDSMLARMRVGRA